MDRQILYNEIKLFTFCEDGYYRVPEWAKYKWLEHGFGTRTSVPPLDLAVVRQVHSADVVIAERTGENGTADALLCGLPGIATGVRTADCFPVLLVDPIHRVAAAVHAGWRGTAQNITVKAADAMDAAFGTKRGDLEAAIGPGIGLCCFEVGPEVAREFGPYEGGAKTYLDLQKINRELLQEAGIGKVYEANACTYCEGLNYFSFRREGERTGRMISYTRIC